MPGFKDRIKAFGKHIKPPTWTKPDPKGFVRAARKTFQWMFPCVKRQEDDCPGLPEVKSSYADEEIPESLASRSRISLMDSESDACPAEAGLESMSDSLEGIPELLEAESFPSLMENDEEKEAAGKGKDGEKDFDSHDPCPAEAESNPAPASALDSLPQPQVTDAEEASPETLAAENLSSSTDSEASSMEADPGPKSDRVPEPQGRTSDEKRSDQQFDGDEFHSSPTDENLHLLCRTFPKLSKEQKCKFADTLAFKHLDLILEHFLEAEETACDQLMYAVLRSPKCNLDACMHEFIIKVNEYQLEDSKELPLAKVKALRGIKAIVADVDNLKGLKYWLQYHFVTQANFLVSQFHPKEEGTSRKLKMYLVPGEAIDILAILLLRLDLVHSMRSTLCPT